MKKYIIGLVLLGAFIMSSETITKSNQSSNNFAPTRSYFRLDWTDDGEYDGSTTDFEWIEVELVDNIKTQEGTLEPSEGTVDHFDGAPFIQWNSGYPVTLYVKREGLSAYYLNYTVYNLNPTHDANKLWQINVTYDQLMLAPLPE